MIVADKRHSELRYPEDLARSMLGSLMFSTIENEVGYSLDGYPKVLSGKTWSEVITEAAFLYVHQPNVSRKLLENLKSGLDEMMRKFSRNGLLVSIKITSQEFPTFIIAAGENSGNIAATVSTFLTSFHDDKLSLKIELKVWWK